MPGQKPGIRFFCALPGADPSHLRALCTHFRHLRGIVMSMPRPDRPAANSVTGVQANARADRSIR